VPQQTLTPTMGRPIDDALYEAVLTRSPHYDGRYYIAVRSTGIVCFPSCRSRTPKRVNILVYTSYEAAIGDAFRPCKRCTPDLHSRPPGHDVVEHVNTLLQTHWNQPISLMDLGTALNMSPSHLQRLYTRYCGISPQKALEIVRMEHAQTLLENTALTVTEVAHRVGFRSRSHFVHVFSRTMGITPSAFRPRRS